MLASGAWPVQMNVQSPSQGCYQCSLACPPPCSSRVSRLPQAGQALYSGPLGVLRGVVAHEGGLLGLGRGLVPTVLREVPGNAASFLVSGAAKAQLAAWQVGREVGRAGGGGECAKAALCFSMRVLATALQKGWRPRLYLLLPPHRACQGRPSWGRAR